MRIKMYKQKKPTRYSICCSCLDEITPASIRPSCKKCYSYYKSGGKYYKCNKCNSEFEEPIIFGTCYYCYRTLVKENLERENLQR